MRKYQQQMILDMLKQCQEKHKYINGMALKQFREVADGLSICKEYAVTIGEFIEQIYGQGSQTVTFLEEYCDLLDDSILNINEYSFILFNEKLNEVTNCVRHELIVDKIEVAFFPYKVSMADSLESIYMFAKEDLQCDAYWIPVPFYNKAYSTLGIVDVMQYEADSYSSKFEVIDWKSYDVGARHPDIVFIHNPYDEYNQVTRIHPDYYSHVLRNQTDCLVYIDYGIPIWQSRNPYLHVGIENEIKLHSAVLHSNAYVAYSMELAESYRIALLNSKQTKNKYTESEVKEKVIALGSPKFDKVLSVCKEDTILPNKWSKQIGNRKVLLFNSSLDELLSSDDQFLIMITKVINALQFREDIILWWRPHPLTFETLCSMRPQLLADYRKIVDDYNLHAKGIYDDTDDVHRAIAWSDGCLTTTSSLAFLYLATGKPFTLLEQKMKLSKPIYNNEDTFTRPLLNRIEYMSAAKGANVLNLNMCIWWHNFLDEDILKNIHYDNFIDRFIHYIVHTDSYPQAEEYKQLQLKMFNDFVENSDGTAGQKIYEYFKKMQTGIV